MGGVDDIPYEADTMNFTGASDAPTGPAAGRDDGPPHRWRCAGCSSHVFGWSADKATGPHHVCKGYCHDEAGCPGRACPGCGQKHYWTAAEGGRP